MSKLPRIKAGQIVAVLEKVGFICVRQSGSHKIYINEKGKRVTIPLGSEVAPRKRFIQTHAKAVQNLDI